MEKLKMDSLISYRDLLYRGQYLGELQPIYDRRKSFYGKAKLYLLNNVVYLVSYSTIVAKVYDNFVQVFGWYSQTTSRHINEFLRQFNFETLTKKQMDSGSSTYGAIFEM